MVLTNKKVVVIGAGRSGIAAAKLAASKGGRILITDSSGSPELKQKLALLKKHGINCETGGHSGKAFEQKDIVVISPGVNPYNPIVKKIMNNAGEVLSEVELAFRFIKSPIIAVTGTNGKTTTSALITHIFNSSGYKAVSAGNIGSPLSDFVLFEGIIIAEISSFQLERIKTFKPETVVLLNLTPDHQDRYPDTESYYSAKIEILKNLTENETVIYNMDCEETATRLSSCKNPKKLRFSLNRTADASLKSSIIYLKDKNQKEAIIEKNDIPLVGKHNVYNTLAALLAAKSHGLNTCKIVRGIKSFSGVPHRLEKVAEINSRIFYNDSKSTNLESLKWALMAFRSPVNLIAGGKDKFDDLKTISGLLKNNVKNIYLIGEAAERFYKNWKPFVKNIKIVDNLKKAVIVAYKESNEGEIILLSPASSSYDMFNNFEERGDFYKSCVSELTNISTNLQGIRKV